MDFSLGYKLVCMVGTIFVIFPCSSVGLFSDYKICGDLECESLMSRVQAIKDHRGKDCRFLNFRRGDNIFVYHKLTGKREDLWAGSIDKQFGYFPKDAVKEEQVYATTEKVVETQKSDFFCMDESGYPIDTTDLVDDDDHDDDENLQTQESENIQMNANAHETDAAGSAVSSDAFSEVKAQEVEEENHNLNDATEPHEEGKEGSTTEKEQGGSPSSSSSSSWLGSSVTGWLGSSKEEQSGSLDELAGEDEGKNTGADSSLTSSVTGWLGFGGDQKSDNVEENVELDEESYTSTVTGWLGLGGDKKAVDVENEQNGEQEIEPVEKFWSRRMSLPLEGSEVEEEKETEMGTFGWLGSGISSRLGFGQNKQDVEDETKPLVAEADKQQEQEASGSWMDMGIGGMLGFGNDKADDKEGDIKDTEKDKSLEAENLDTDESQASTKCEVKTETSKESRAEEPTSVPSTEPVSADSSHTVINDNSDRRESNTLDDQDEVKVDHKDDSPQAVVEMSSSFSQTDENKTNVDRSVEMEADKTHDSAGNTGEGEMREPVIGEVIDTSSIKDFVTPSRSSLGPDHSFDDAVSKSMEPFEGREEEEAKEQTPKSVEVPTIAQNVEESDMKHDFSGGAPKEALSEKTTNSSHPEMFTTQAETSAEESRISSDAEESKEQNQPSSLKRDEFIPDEKSFRPLEAETTTPAITDDHVETKINQEELGLEGSSQEFAPFHSDNKNLPDDILKEDSKIILTNINQTLGSPQMEEKVAKTLSDAESWKDPNKETGMETTNVKEDVSSEKSTIAPETESEIIEEAEKMKTGEKEERENILKEEEKKQEVNEVKKDEQQVGAKDRNEKEKNNMENAKNKVLNEENQQQVEEVKEGENQDNPNRLDGFKESEEKMEEELESNNKETLDEGLSTETKQPERQMVEQKQNVATSEKVKDEKIEQGTAEKQHIMHEENEQPECLHQVCPVGKKEEVEEGGASEDRASSTDVAARMAENKTDQSNDVAEEQMLKNDDTTFGSGSHNDGNTLDSAEGQIQSEHEEDPTESSDPAEATERRGTLGLFKNALGLFSQTASTTSTESAECSNTSTAEPSQTPVSEPDLDPTSDPVPPSEHPENIHPTAPSTTETPVKTSPLTQPHKRLLAHMSAEETALLLELFGRPKLQFLDYILGSSEGVTAGDDQSILSDIDRLLDHHRETLLAPRTRLADAPQEDEEKTRTLIALQKLELLLKTIKVPFSTGISDVSKHPVSCSNVDESSCGTCSTQEEEQKDNPRDEQMTAVKDQTGRADEASLHHTQPGSQNKGFMKKTLDIFLGMIENSKDVLIWIYVKVVSSLPDDIRPGPDLYGVPWEPVLITGLVGLVTFLLFTCRCYRSIKSRMYRSKEKWMAQQITQLLDEKCKVLETLSQCQQEYDELENTLRDGGVLAQTQKTEQLEVQARQLTDAKKELGRDLDQLKAQLEQQREQRKEQERRISELEESIKTSELETKDLLSQEEQAQTTVKIYDMNSERLQGNLETAREENRLLEESNAQLKQQVEGWAERVSELEAEMQRCELAHSAMLQDVALKDERIMSLTDRLLRMKGWDSDLEEVGGEEVGEKETNLGTPQKEDRSGRGDLTDTHLQKVQKLIYAAKLNADLKSVDEDKDRAFAKLNDEIKAKEDLQVSIQELENEKLSLQSDSKHYSDEVERLQQKLQIMTEMYQENELKLHRMLTVEEKERLQKEEKLNKADKNIAMALEELNNYRKRANEMEEELEKTKQSYQTQISAHETKAHNNWLAARAAERDLGDIRRENSLLRQKITDTQFKLDSLDNDPYALNSLARPLPFRAERSPYVSSPYGRPSSETRPFLSPPTLMDGPPARLSPRVSRGPVDPPGGQRELERGGGPHSDSGSNSPTWEQDRRGPGGPLGPPGYTFPEPGAPMFRRAPPPPAALGLLPPPGPFPPRGLPPGPPHPADVTDGAFRENHLGPGDQDPRLAGPGDQRPPHELDPRMGGPPPRLPLVPMDGLFPRRAPYGPPPPPDFYPPRGPGALPMMPMWPPPQRMLHPPRLPPGGPPLPPAPHPNRPFYGPPMVHPPNNGPPPPQQSLPSPPHNQSLEENRPSPEDVI